MGISCAPRAWRLFGIGALIAWLSACTAIADLDRFESAAGSGGRSGKPDGGAESGRGGGSGTSGGGGTSGTRSDAGTRDAAIDAGGADGGGTDGGTSIEVPGCESPRTLCVRLRRFGLHVIQLVQVDLVTTAGNNLRARAILDPFARSGVEQADIVMPLSLSPEDVPGPGEDAPLHIEMFADQNGDDEYTPDEDHDWNLDLPPDAKLVFDHSSAFSSIEPPPRGLGADFRMHLSGLDDHVGDLFELMVIEKGSGRAVGLYRTHSLPAAEHDILIPDIIDPSLTDGYVIEAYADVNRNYVYDPGVDASRVMEAIPTADGLDLELEDNPAPLGYQFPFVHGS